MGGSRGGKMVSWMVVGVVLLGLAIPSVALRPLKERASSAVGSWNDERLFLRRDESKPSVYSMWNITGTYKGKWSFVEKANSTSRFLDFGKSTGESVIELVSTPTKIIGVHYVQGALTFHNIFDDEQDHGMAQMRVEGVYIWPFRQLRMVANGGADGDPLQEEYFLSNPYHLLGVFSTQVFQESSRDKIQRKRSLTYDMEKHCSIEITAQVSRISSSQNGAYRYRKPQIIVHQTNRNRFYTIVYSEITSLADCYISLRKELFLLQDGDHDQYHLEGVMESPAADDDGECFSPIMLNSTSLNIEVYYNKAVNYTLMVTFVSFLQVLLLIRQMEHSNTQSGAAKVSIVMIGQQAIMDAYLCLLHLTAGILVESLFNAFATAAFFKFVVFSIFEMRYLLAIWKASRPMNSGEGWETIRHELSVLYSCFYGILLGGILIIYELHNFLGPILFIMYSFWIPQIISNVVRDSRKPLHPNYIIGMTLSRLAIPLYLFGCPSNFMRIEVDKDWCIYLGVFVGIQALVLLLQHYLGSRWFIPRQILPEKYSYYRRLLNDATQAADCVICMTAIDLTQQSNDYMVTPCEHCFHSGCLQRWMDIKMECPTCRRSLPPA